LEHVVHALDSVASNALAEQMDAKAKEMVEFARGMIGTYEHSGDWPQLSPITQADRERLGFPPNEPLLREGTLRDSYSYDLTVTPSVIFLMVGSDDVRSIFHELGTETMPPRPILGPTANAFEQEMEQVLGEKVASAIFARLDGAFARLR
jgi:HK97 gp10 family phage protein